MKILRYGGQLYPDDFLLASEGFWAASRLDVEHILFSSGTEGNESLVAGRVDVAVGSDSKTVALFSRIPKRAVVLACTQGGNRYSTIVKSDSTASSWGDLKGKRVAVRLGTGAELVLRRFFELNDLNWRDFQHVNLPVENMVRALEGGQIEAFTAWSITPEISISRGVGRRLVSYGKITSVPVCIHSTRSFVESNRELLIKMLMAHLRKAAMIRENPNGAAKLAAMEAARRAIHIPQSAFLDAFQRIDFSVSLSEKRLKAIEKTAEFLKERNAVSRTSPIYVNYSILEQARKRLENRKDVD